MRLFRRRRSSSSSARTRKSRFRVRVELLESRALLSLTPIDFGATITSSPVAMNGALYFAATDLTNGTELWKSDGTAAGTVMVNDISPGVLGSNPTSLTVMGNTLFFAASDGVHGPELWESDGTTAGTFMVKDVYTGAIGSYPKNLTDVNGTLFYQAFDPHGGYELFRSDGTTAGTYIVKDARPGFPGSFPSNLTAVGSTLFFSANDGTNGTELWESDGTTAGTVMVSDINPGGAGSFPGDLTNVNGTLFFTANDGVHGFELWKSDGTAAGTVMVSDINPGATGSIPSYLTNLNGTLLFTAKDATHGYELWKSDGTSAGTVMVSDIDPGSASSLPNHLTTMGSTLCFSANDGTNGTQLWKSDGTAAGTVMVCDINPGGGSTPTNLMVVNGTLYFAATTSTYGNEFWQSDGTSGGTVQVQDIYAGSPSSNPTNLADDGSSLFLTATDATHSSRLWTLSGSSSASVRVGSSLPNSTYGQSVSFTVAVSGAGPMPTGTVQFLVDGTDFGSAVTLVSGSATSASTTLLGAGNHTVEADYSGDANYPAGSGTYTQVVNQAPLSIIPDNLTRAVGEANPPLTYTFTGFVNGDDATTAGITGSAHLATTATTSSPPGDYPITVIDIGTLAAANYNFPSSDFGTGTLTVTPSGSTISIGDPGFEQVVVGSGQFQYCPTGSPWTFAGGSGISGNNSGFTAGNPPAPEGVQVAFLQTTGSFSQSVADWAAGSYVLSFEAAQRGNYQASRQDFNVLIDGSVVGTFTPSGTSYQSYSTAAFTVTAGSHTIAFQGLDSAGGDNTAFVQRSRRGTG